MTYNTPVTELYRLFETDELSIKNNTFTGADSGRTLDSVLQTYYGMANGIADLVPTFVDDFDDVTATMGNSNGGKTWMCPGELLTSGIMIPQRFTAGNYVQEGPSILGMQAIYVPGVARKSCNATTGFYGTDLNATPIINWCQQFGYFEARFQPANPTGSNCINYPAFWLRSLNFFGGLETTGNPFHTNIEDDIVEAYNTHDTAAAHFGTDRTIHTSLHHHEPQKLNAPGEWGRDVYSRVAGDVRSYAGFGSPPTLEMWDDYHLWSVLHAPDFNWYFWDRKLYGKMVRIPEMHDRYVMYISNGSTGEAPPAGMTPNVPYTMKVDYVKAWQHPDWQTTPLGVNINASALGGNQTDSECLTGEGTANAKTFNSVAPMVAYAERRGFVLKFATANTAACTLEGGALGEKNVYTYPISGRDVFPQSGTPVALTGGEIGANEWKYFQYDTTLDGGAGGWLLFNPNYSMERAAIWKPEPLVVSSAAVDVLALEAGFVNKHGIDPLLFPADHPARNLTPIDGFIAPAMEASTVFHKVEGATQGTIVGSVAVSNTPTDQIRYHQVGATTHYSTDPATGAIAVATGYTTAIGSEEFLVYAWPVPPRQIIRGSNVTRVVMDVQASKLFDLSFFAGIATWIDAQSTSTLALDGSNKVLSWTDKAPAGLVWKDDPLLADIPPVYNATAMNGLPAVQGAPSGARMLTSYFGATKKLPAMLAAVPIIVNRINPVPCTSMSIGGITRIPNTFEFRNAHMCLYVWTKTPSHFTVWVNGDEVGPNPTANQASITSPGWAFVVQDGVSAGGNGFGRIYEAGRLLNSSLLTVCGDTNLGEFAMGTDVLTQALIDKIFGYAADHWNLRGLLRADHPYKTTVPQMFE